LPASRRLKSSVASDQLGEPAGRRAHALEDLALLRGLVTTPEGTVFVALTFTEAKAIADRGISRHRPRTSQRGTWPEPEIVTP
jgi:hypothetical protein